MCVRNIEKLFARYLESPGAVASDAPEGPNHLLRLPSLRYVVVAHKSPVLNESCAVCEVFYDTLYGNLILTSTPNFEGWCANLRETKHRVAGGEQPTLCGDPHRLEN